MAARTFFFYAGSVVFGGILGLLEMDPWEWRFWVIGAPAVIWASVLAFWSVETE